MPSRRKDARERAQITLAGALEILSQRRSAETAALPSFIEKVQRCSKTMSTSQILGSHIANDNGAAGPQALPPGFGPPLP